MQLLFRFYVTAGVAVIGASLIYVTPSATPDTGRSAVALVVAGNVIDAVGPIDSAVSSLGGGDVLAVPSPADVDLPQYLDPAFWDYWWSSIGTADPIGSWFGLINALSSIPVIGPLFSVVGIVSFALLFLSGGPQSAAADGWDTGSAPLDEAGMAVGVNPVLDDIIALIGGAPGVSELAAVLEDPGDTFASSIIIAIPELDDVLMSITP